MGYLYVFIGGGIGAMVRYAISGWLGQGTENGIPWHTLLSNLSCLSACRYAYGLVAQNGLLYRWKIMAFNWFCGDLVLFLHLA